MITSINKEQFERFEDYVITWRIVFVDVLGWSEADFQSYVRDQRKRLRHEGATTFFHDTAYKRICWELLRGPAKDLWGYRGAHMLLKAITGRSLQNIHKSDFDVSAAQDRYHRALLRLRHISKEGRE
jgi:hypothetical protein